jgi:hypothetical protein
VTHASKEKGELYRDGAGMPSDVEAKKRFVPVFAAIQVHQREDTFAECLT